MLLAASFDRPEDNRSFRSTHGFPFRLLSDEDHQVGRLYETERHPSEPSPENAKRRTYIVDPEGVIRRAYRVRDILAHPGEVLEDLRALQASG